MIRRSLFVTLALLSISSTSFALDVKKAAPETVADLLLFYDMNELITSVSKRSQKISETPSPVYVFTAEDIKRTGVRNLMELVKFIPGFYVYPKIDQTFRIVTRGINSYDKILFLIDGIPLNNIAQGGAVNVHIFPGLDKVQRVEVIPGPGSTMWGSDAALGIISIITKDGKDINGNYLNVNLASEDNHIEANFLSGKEFTQGGYMFSATYAQNDGFGNEKFGFENYVHDFGSIPWNDQRANFNHIYPSYEIYGKFKYRDFTLKALASEKSIYSFWNTSQSTNYHDVQDKKSIHTSREVHLELGHHSEITENMTLETKLSAKRIDYIRDKVVEVGDDHGSDFVYDPDDPNDVFKEPIHNRTEIFPEKGAGLEFLLNWDINQKNKLTAGTRLRVVEAGPGEYKRFNVDTGEPPASIEARTVLYNKITDKTFGAYIEDTYFATDYLTLIGGIRLDYNDPRETTSVIMPRGATIYQFSDSLFLKYMYNTGYLRPQMGKSFAVALSKAGSVKESEKIKSHDLALIYNTEKTQFSADLFYMTIYDLFTYDADQARFINEGDIFTQGLELSFKRNFLDGRLFFDLNYGYAKTEKEDEFGNKSNYYQGIPKHVYGAGLTYLFTDKILLNANITGWHDLEMDHARATIWYDEPKHPDSYSGDYTVDLNLGFTDLLNDRLDLSLYVKNVFDNEARLQALDSWHSWWSYERGRSIGIKTTWRF